MVRVHIVRTVLEMLRDAVEIAAIVAAGLWAIYTFVYEQRIKPAAQAESVNVYADVRALSNGGKTFLILTKHFENKGTVAADIAAESMSVYGERLHRRTRRLTLASDAFGSVRDDLERSSPHLLYAYFRLRAGAIGGIAGTHILLRPGSNVTERFVVAVPRGSYDLALIATYDVEYRYPSSRKIRVTVQHDPRGGYVLSSTNGMDNDELEVPIAGSSSASGAL